jgi:hypothetical protein
MEEANSFFAVVLFGPPCIATTAEKQLDYSDLTHSLNMELDLQILFGLNVT